MVERRLKIAAGATGVIEHEPAGCVIDQYGAESHGHLRGLPLQHPGFAVEGTVVRQIQVDARIRTVVGHIGGDAVPAGLAIDQVPGLYTGAQDAVHSRLGNARLVNDAAQWVQTGPHAVQGLKYEIDPGVGGHPVVHRAGGLNKLGVAH